MCVSKGGAEREGDTESEAGSRFWAVSTEPDAGLKLKNHEIMTWAEVGSLTNWAAQGPFSKTLLKVASPDNIKNCYRCYTCCVRSLW